MLTSTAATRTAPASTKPSAAPARSGRPPGWSPWAARLRSAGSAYQATVLDHLTLGLVLTVVALLGLTIALRQRSKSSEVHLENGTLRLRHGDQHHTFYLTSSSTKLEMSGNPGRQGLEGAGAAPRHGAGDHRSQGRRPRGVHRGSAPVATEPVGEKRTPRAPARRPAAEEMRRLRAERDALEATCARGGATGGGARRRARRGSCRAGRRPQPAVAVRRPCRRGPRRTRRGRERSRRAPHRPGGDRAGGRHGGAARGTRPWARITRGAGDAGTDLPRGLPGLEQPGRAVRGLGEPRHGLHRLELQQLPVRPAPRPPPRSR